jgi:hypothetical protein
MVKEADKTVERCRGCGKPVEEGSAHVLIERVAKKAGRVYRSKESWGRMHTSCFARMTGKPKDLFDVLSEREAQLLTTMK